MDCLVRAGELADTAECASVEVHKPAVRAPFRAVEFWDDNAPAVGFFSFFKDLIRANLRTEIATLAPGLVNGEFHESPIVYYGSWGEKNLFFISIPHMVSYFFCVLFIFVSGTLYHLLKEIIAVCIDTDHKREVVKFDHPDRFCHAKILKKYSFYGHMR